MSDPRPPADSKAAGQQQQLQHERAEGAAAAAATAMAGEGGGRERWSSRPAFIFASVGAAIGLGNIWRFPALCYEYGGGAFFIPYLLALLFVGIPILLLEVALGQTYRSGDAVCFGHMHPRLRGVGLGSLWCGYMVVCYYCVLLAWAVRMFGYSATNAPWRGMTGIDAWVWFTDEVAGLETVGEDLEPTKIVGATAWALLFVWALIFASLAFGVRFTGRLTYVTVLLPALLVLVLVIRTATLDGASEGVREYIGIWDMSVLSEGEMWSRAVSQIFFSIGVTFGIMTAYGSYNPVGQVAAVDSVIIAISNSFFSFVSGFAVFGTLGYLAHLRGVGIEDLPRVAGPGLMFGTLPVALSTLPGGGNWERLLFVVLLFLGIDSAFSLVEGVVTALRDTRGFAKTARLKVVGFLCVFGFCVSLLYATDSGFFFLDVADYYINFVMLMVGFFETWSAGWVFGVEEQAARVGSPFPGIALAVGSLASSAIAVASGQAGLELYGVLVWLAVYACFCVFAYALLPKRDWDSLQDLFLGNVEELRAALSSVVGPIPWIWSVLIKHILPPLLLALFLLLVVDKNEDDKLTLGNYEDYPTLYQVFGIAIAVLCPFIVLMGVIMPNALDSFAPLKRVAGRAESSALEEPPVQS